MAFARWLRLPVRMLKQTRPARKAVLRSIQQHTEKHMHRISKSALLVSGLLSAALAMSAGTADHTFQGTFNGASYGPVYNGTTLNGLSANGLSANGIRQNGLLPHGTVLNVEGPTGLKAPHASARNGRLFVR